jgi:uncharacterized protein (DUF2062 family)
VTILFLYPAQCWVGSRVLGNGLSWAVVTESFKGVFEKQDWASLMELSGHLVASFFVGGFLLAAIATPIMYFAVLFMVRAYRRRSAHGAEL